MKKLFLFAVVLFVTTLSLAAQTHASGYFKNNGTYVQPHTRSSKNYTNHDNWSTRGNINPYTGSYGTRARDYSSGALNYGSGRTIQTGPKGGQYYRNDFGNKTYVPKRSSGFSSSYNYNTTTTRRKSRSTFGY